MAKKNCSAFYAILSPNNEAMKPSKLKRHLQHPEHVEKDFIFFERQKLLLKRQKLDTSGYFQEQSTANLTTSLEVALQIAKQKKTS